MKECPKCGLTNPDSAPGGRCGYKFQDFPDFKRRLEEKLESLVQRHEQFQQEIDKLRDEMDGLELHDTVPVAEDAAGVRDEIETAAESQKAADDSKQSLDSKEGSSVQPALISSQDKSRKKILKKSDLEKFIGENLFNKIGILIIIIGVAIGAKYAIDNQLISPLTRIVLGYMAGLSLLGFAIKLKPKYKNFSAVLLSGALAILYFITFFAYSIYDLVPQISAFILMVIFTIFTVIAALNYNKQVIALIGLVGAYGVPFLLSEDSGRILLLFSYISIINTGILFIAFKKYWKLLYYSSFILTWLIFFSWYSAEYEMDNHFGAALFFLTVLFMIFYVTILAYKLIQKEKYAKSDIWMLLANTFIFFGTGYSILNGHDFGRELLGLFTVLNALVHFAAAVLIYRDKLADRNLFYLVTGLVLVFITIAVPVQLDGNWVTLLWAGEALLLFWIGRAKSVSIYEKLSYPLILLALLSLLHDWQAAYGLQYISGSEEGITPFFNAAFSASVLVITSLAFIYFFNKKYTSAIKKDSALLTMFRYSLPALLLLLIYFTFRMELAEIFDQLYADSKVLLVPESQINSGHVQFNSDILKFKDIWLLNYSFLFLAVLSFVNIRRFKSAVLGNINLILNAMIIIVFLSEGLSVLSSLRESYLNQNLAEYYNTGILHLLIRYISYIFIGILMIVSFRQLKQDFASKVFRVPFDIFISFTLLWISSSELINWMQIYESAHAYKLGLSILWGIFALLLSALGIWKTKKHLRVSAIVLFTAALLKLFFYDVSHLSTLYKTLLFLILGILMLVISFLYNKYKQVIFDEDEN